jgi:hypothetical protein
MSGGNRFEQSLAELSMATERAGRRLDTERALRDIESAVSRYSSDWRRRSERLTPARRRDHYEKLLHAVQTAREAYQDTLRRDQLINPLVWALGEPDWQSVEFEVTKTVRRLEVQERWLKEAYEQAKQAVGKGRSPGSTLPGLGLFVNALADAWERQTKEAAGRSRSQAVEKNPYGPFIRFVEAVVEEAELQPLSINLPEYVSDRIKDRRFIWGRQPRLLDPEELWAPIDNGE